MSKDVALVKSTGKEVEILRTVGKCIFNFKAKLRDGREKKIGDDVIGSTIKFDDNLDISKYDIDTVNVVSSMTDWKYTLSDGSEMSENELIIGEQNIRAYKLNILLNPDI
jgi:hypothetical protein